MADSFGASFVPGTDQQTPGVKLPTGQQPIQMLNLRLPKVVGAQAIAPQNLLDSRGPGGGNADLASAVVRSVLAAMGHQLPEPSAPAANLSGMGAASAVPMGSSSQGLPSIFSQTTQGAGPAMPTPPPMSSAPPIAASPTAGPVPPPMPSVSPPTFVETPSTPSPFQPPPLESAPSVPSQPTPAPTFRPDAPPPSAPASFGPPSAVANPGPSAPPPPDYQGLINEAWNRVGGSDWNSYKGLASTDPFVAQFAQAFGPNADWNALRPR